MDIKKNILFIINPISGGKDKKLVPDIIDKYLDKSIFNSNFSFTAQAGHGKQIAEEAIQKNFDIIVACGGDGTINEVATVVLKYNKILGLIPLGSGNGFANYLNISKNVKNAVLIINQLNIQKIDTATFNGLPFFSIAGLGFDAFLSELFVKSKIRGVFGYIYDGLKGISTYKAQPYLIEIDGIKYDREAFAVSIANTNQYGNNIYISPKASITDGLLDVCIIKPFKLISLPFLSYSMLVKRAEQNNMIEIIKGKHVKIYRWKPGVIHIDGEPKQMGQEIEIIINPLSLQVLTSNTEDK